MRRFTMRALGLGGLIYAAFTAWTAWTMSTYADPTPLPQASAIVVVSGAWTPADQPKGESRIRVDRGVALWQQGLAPLIVMSGGGQRALRGPGDATFMATHARSLGVPDAAILIEDTSHSTLQNGWNTRRLSQIDPDAPILLVTHRFHLARAKASFRWAGFGDVTGVAADPGEATTVTGKLLWEGVKWPVNILRATAVSLALAAGQDDQDVYPWLH